MVGSWFAGYLHPAYYLDMGTFLFSAGIHHYSFLEITFVSNISNHILYAKSAPYSALQGAGIILSRMLVANVLWSSIMYLAYT